MNTIREQWSKDVLGFRRPIISGLGATRTLTEGESGSTVLLDKADGITITLPASAGVGTFFMFKVSVSSTSVGYKVITGAGTELLVGSIVNCDTDTSDAVAIWKALVGSSYISVNLGGSNTTKGGLEGDWFEVEKLDATTWSVKGVTNATGTVATPFSTS